MHSTFWLHPITTMFIKLNNELPALVAKLTRDGISVGFVRNRSSRSLRGSNTEVSLGRFLMGGNGQSWMTIETLGP